MSKPLSPLESARGLITEECRVFLSTLTATGQAETLPSRRAHVETFRHRLHRFRRHSLDGLANASPKEAEDFRHWIRTVIHPSLTPQMLELMTFRPLSWPPGSPKDAPTYTLLGIIRKPLMPLSPNGASALDLDIITQATQATKGPQS